MPTTLPSLRLRSEIDGAEFRGTRLGEPTGHLAVHIPSDSGLSMRFDREAALYPLLGTGSECGRLVLDALRNAVGKAHPRSTTTRFLGAMGPMAPFRSSGPVAVRGGEASAHALYRGVGDMLLAFAAEGPRGRRLVLAVAELGGTGKVRRESVLSKNGLGAYQTVLACGSARKAYLADPEGVCGDLGLSGVHHADGPPDFLAAHMLALRSDAGGTWIHLSLERPRFGRDGSVDPARTTPLLAVDILATHGGQSRPAEGFGPVLAGTDAEEDPRAERRRTQLFLEGAEAAAQGRAAAFLAERSGRRPDAFSATEAGALDRIAREAARCAALRPAMEAAAGLRSGAAVPAAHLAAARKLESAMAAIPRAMEPPVFSTAFDPLPAPRRKFLPAAGRKAHAEEDAPIPFSVPEPGDA